MTFDLVGEADQRMLFVHDCEDDDDLDDPDFDFDDSDHDPLAWG